MHNINDNKIILENTEAHLNFEFFDLENEQN